jgi:mannose-1-phosphate guanylyltransferase/mannose-6-phosphate isomerase
MDRIQAVIMAGGSGSRLWPVSRSMYPKQLLPLVSERTMLQETVARLDGLDSLADDCIVVCSEAHRFLVAEQLAGMSPAARLLLEPSGRNTAPAIALAALYALSQAREGDGDPVLLVLSADHVIEESRAFHAAAGMALAAARDGALVTFGVVPTSPHTGYGYIEADAEGAAPVDIRSFVEKPDAATARAYLDGGRHFWNSGMFMFRADRYLEELETHAPDILIACRAAMDSATSDPDFVRPCREAFLACRADSIDYAVMEKTQRAKMVPLDAGWNDVGSWEALYALAERDGEGNVTVGDTLLYGARNSLVSSESRLVAAVGIDGLVIVETRDAVLIADRKHAQDVKQLVDALNRAERPETAFHREVFRPWGSFDSLEHQDGFQVKRLVVNPGAVLSLQLHHHRAEHWVVVKGTARITLNDDEFDLNVNESVYVPVGAKHRIANTGTEPVHIIEVQCGDYLGEDDIVRFEDNYGREGTTT